MVPPLSLEQYITCYSDCELKYLEALAMIGLALNVKLENCDRKGFVRLILELFNSKSVSSKCYFEEEARQSLKIIVTYIDFAKKRGSSGQLKVVEASEDKEY